jgi:hypothetical protein
MNESFLKIPNLSSTPSRVPIPKARPLGSSQFSYDFMRTASSPTPTSLVSFLPYPSRILSPLISLEQKADLIYVQQHERKISAKFL